MRSSRSRRRRLPGRVQHERDQSQRHGRARARAGHRQGRQVPASGPSRSAENSGRCRAPIVGILLGAGSGSRFGGDKLLAKLADGGPWHRAALVTSRAGGRRGHRRRASRRRRAGNAVRPVRCARHGVPRCGRRHGREPRVRRARSAARARGLAVVALADMPWIVSVDRRAHRGRVAARRGAGGAVASRNARPPGRRSAASISPSLRDAYRRRRREGLPGGVAAASSS